MKIVLQQLRITNFKGMANKTIAFGHETNIHGANASGKTTIADAWYWLLFGKNSTDDKAFSIKNTVDTSLNTMDHEVEGTLLIDGETVVLKRVYREKWTKKKGRERAEYTGNEQDFYRNDVPMKAGEYQSMISKILEEELFKKITNPTYFNSIAWQKRRETLIAMAGDVTLQDVAGTDKDFNDLLEKLGKDSLEDYRKKLAARISKLKDDIQHLPSNIKTLRETIADEPDFSQVEAEIKSLSDELNGIDVALNDKGAALRKFHDEQADIQAKINKQNRDLADLKHKITMDLQQADRNNTAGIEAAKRKVAVLEADLVQLNKDKANAEQRVAGYTKTLDGLRAEWAAINAEVFEYPDFKWDDHEESCPTCKRAFDAETIDTRKAKLQEAYEKARLEKETLFNSNKARRKEDNKASGINTKVALDNANASLQGALEAITTKHNELDSAKKELVELEAKYTAPAPLEERVKEALAANKQAVTILDTIKELQAELKEEPVEENADVKARKQEILSALATLNKQLGQRDTYAATKVKIDQLIASEKTLNQQLADTEREDDIRIRFEKARIETMVSMVNGLFQYVKFKLFNYTVEGGEVPTCETMLDGVPYSDLNTAGKMKAGIDIINALSKNYNTWAPIFLDNRESVTSIPDTESQVINLIVSPSDRLRVEASAAELALA